MVTLIALDKTVGFITNAGYNSIGEAVSSGTPCVLIPLIGDQWRNARLAEYRMIRKNQNSVI
uniref:glucuronosyltransferase n=1 Tax=Heterorhabditis bacteriophora TaxID=37862 RepID=A0A1I7WMB9_HETBA